MGSIKTHLTFAFKVFVALLIVNFIVDALASFGFAQLRSYINQPFSYVKALVSGGGGGG